MKKNHDFEESFYTKTAEGIHKISRYSIQIMKPLCYPDRSYYENVNYFVLMATVLTCLKEVSY